MRGESSESRRFTWRTRTIEGNRQVWTDVTIVGYSGSVHQALRAATLLEHDGIEADLGVGALELETALHRRQNLGDAEQADHGNEKVEAAE